MKRVTIHDVMVSGNEPFTLADDERIIGIEAASYRDHDGRDLKLGWRVTYITESKE